MFVLKHGCDTYALARSREDMGMLADAMRETLAVLRANGRRIVPTVQFSSVYFHDSP